MRRYELWLGSRGWSPSAAVLRIPSERKTTGTRQQIIIVVAEADGVGAVYRQGRYAEVVVVGVSHASSNSAGPCCGRWQCPVVRESQCPTNRGRAGDGSTARVADCTTNFGRFWK
jgi:hypothetical protein